MRIERFQSRGKKSDQRLCRIARVKVEVHVTEARQP